VEGALALATFLQRNSALISLSLRSNPIRSKGARAIGEALTNNSTLLSLNLGRTLRLLTQRHLNRSARDPIPG
jgi:hypothetical protein